MRKKKSKKAPDTVLGTNIRNIRLAKKWSKSRLVKETGLDYHTIAKVENGITPDPRVTTVVKIAKALGKTVEVLTSTPK